jgi:hypothetical protein
MKRHITYVWAIFHIPRCRSQAVQRLMDVDIMFRGILVDSMLPISKIESNCGVFAAYTRDR